MHPDMDYDRPQKNYIIPEVIKNFLMYFQKSISDQNLYEIQNAYENGYHLVLFINLFVFTLFCVFVYMYAVPVWFTG